MCYEHRAKSKGQNNTAECIGLSGKGRGQKSREQSGEGKDTLCPLRSALYMPEAKW